MSHTAMWAAERGDRLADMSESLGFITVALPDSEGESGSRGYCAGVEVSLLPRGN